MKAVEKIYLVDDDKIFLLTAEFSLKRVFPNADISSFNSAEEAIAHMAKDKPDLLLLDLNMPVMDGWSFLSILENSDGLPSFPIYIVSSSIDPAEFQRASQSPFVRGFIEKPLDEQKVKALINK